MNYVSHLEVAHEVDPTQGAYYELGSMLPDLAAMAGAKLLPEMYNDPPQMFHPNGLGVGEWNKLHWGAALHKKTDAVFHDNNIFNGLQREVRPELQAAIGKWAGVKAAHVGTELIIDGLLLEDDEVRRHFWAVQGIIRGSTDSFKKRDNDEHDVNDRHLDALASTSRDPQRLRPLLHEFGVRSIPVQYMSGHGLTLAMRDILHRRDPTFEFSGSEVHLVTKIFEAHQHLVREVMPELWSTILIGIKADPTEAQTEPDVELELAVAD